MLVGGKNPNLWKLSAISPLPKKSNPKSNNDYRPIALTSVIMKCFEKIIKEKLLKYVDLDNYQYAYKRGCSTKDACIGIDYFLRSQLAKPSTYACILFVDFAFAFNTIGLSNNIRELKSQKLETEVRVSNQLYIIFHFLRPKSAKFSY